MRALLYTDHRLNFQTSYPAPQVNDGFFLLKTRVAGICNTDLELSTGMYNFSGVLGHEFVADVVEAANPEWVGRRVVGEITIACGACDFCARGIPSQCRSRKTLGIRSWDGVFADHFILPERNLFVVPERIPDDQAVFVEPLAAVLQVQEAVRISPRERVVVIGMGKLGMLCAQTLKLTGADVIGVVRHERQAQLLQKWGIQPASLDELAPQSAQVVVDCTGNAEGFEAALTLVESRGTIVLKSTYNSFPQADLTQVAVREIHVIGSRCGPFAAALRLLEHEVVDVESMISARYPITEALTAMKHAAQAGMLKVLLDF